MTDAALADNPAPPRPFAGFERMLAFRYLRPRRKEGFISVIAGFSFAGILLGVAALIIVMSVMNGFRKELISKILGISGHVFIQAMDQPLTDYEELAKRFEQIKGVRQAIPVINGQVLVASPFASTGALVRGVREADIRRLESISRNIRAGTLDNFDSGEGIAIGQRLADQLGVRAGDKLTLLSPNGPASPFGQTPRRKVYNIAAVFQIGMSEFDSSFVYMPLKEAQIYFDRDNDVSVIELTIDDPEQAERISQIAIDVAGRPIITSDWKIRNQTFVGALEVERNVMFIILTLIVMVAALNIISGLIMLVRSKSRDIAILRTMGATQGSILRVFLMTGASIGISGTLAGLVIGVFIARNIDGLKNFFSWLSGRDLFPATLYFLSRLPAIVDWREVLTVVTMAIVLSLLASLYPAWKAAKLDPVEALRNE
ncbi:MAG: lipoprotein-releasing ABC transporter permease subunit [Methylocystis sp.]|nr:lipoprotein-releasing ABC transporter permease subunit [Methylocystis sp.]MCA3584472.1 lipoprotein-releasing ABC transporter permease subunit [Methylocystis sp.]MCA3588013.1 lipoprotein-releasing ABC transporter permease subunit [Methylocystis sp.]MCA3590506.1 lipoprotein-releasing ABC transporter permease subunit [Methylocystis sp.]